MKRDHLILVAAVCGICTFGGMWLGSAATLAAPLEQIPSENLALIKGAHDDIKQFLKPGGFDGDFQVITAVRDDVLNRRYYRLRVEPQNIEKISAAVVKGWTWGRINRTVYQNNVSSRLPKSANLPAWWRNLDDAHVSRMMLDHGGVAKWYVVLSKSGDVGLMWTGR